MEEQVVSSEQEFDSLPVGSYVRAEWGQGAVRWVVRAEGGGCSSSSFTVASGGHWRGVWSWAERIVLLYKPAIDS